MRNQWMRNQWLKHAALLLAALPLLPTAGESATASPEEVSSVLPITELKTWMNEAGVPGVSITVIKDFEIHWTLAFGRADASSNRPVTTSTLFQAASISKPVMWPQFCAHGTCLHWLMASRLPSRRECCSVTHRD